MSVAAAAGRSSFRFSSSRDSKADGGAPQLDELDEQLHAEAGCRLA